MDQYVMVNTLIMRFGYIYDGFIDGQIDHLPNFHQFDQRTIMIHGQIDQSPLWCMPRWTPMKFSKSESANTVLRNFILKTRIYNISKYYSSK